MAGTIWGKWYWSDWMSDPALRRCSYAARGLWMDMLCIAATHDPVGYVAVAGQPLSVEDLARMTGGKLAETRKLLDELSRNQVFSRDEAGCIFSRRMLADVQRVEEARANGRLGGNPRLKAKLEDKAGVNPPDKGRDKTQKPEARDQKEPEDKSSGAVIDLDRKAWADAISTLVVQGGMKEASARAFFMKTLSAHGLKAPELLPAISRAMLNQTRDPQGMLTGAAKRIGEDKRRNASGGRAPDLGFV